MDSNTQQALREEADNLRQKQDLQQLEDSVEAKLKQQKELEVANSDLKHKLRQIEEAYRSFVLNPVSDNKTVHKRRASCSPYDPTTQVAVCGWRFGVSRYEPVNSLPEDYKRICGTCMPLERQHEKERFLAALAEVHSFNDDDNRQDQEDDDTESASESSSSDS